ncbi:glycosyltransferase family 2 protein [Polynucleobacter paneuropaeus]|jgi:putative glycosyltransferase|nr:glycosyltransferase family 2 protein [Polynucleobacter paneuropaeus]
MKLSIVSTLYQSEIYINEFYERVVNSAKQVVGDSYEIILVNDGSPDDSFLVAKNIVLADGRVKLIDLSRNFGHHKAMMAGLSYATGERVFLIDSDLEEDPEWLLRFYVNMNEKHCDVIYGVQTTRKGMLFERISGHFYYRLMNFWLGLNLPENIVTARLMTSRFVKDLLRHDEREMFLGGLFSLVGYDQLPVPVKKHSTSETTYNISKRMALLVDTVTSFSDRPLIGMFYLGFVIFTITSAFVFYLIINWLFFSRPPSGWTSVIASIWLLGGMMISFMGIIGIYLAKVFKEAKKRPYTVVRGVYGKTDPR